MGRKPKIRVSYYNDAQYLMRLIHALERDTSMPMDWRMKRIDDCRKLAMNFMNAGEKKAKVA